MSVKRFTTKGFIKFCDSLPPDKPITYVDSIKCPLGLYAETLGYVHEGWWSPWRQLMEHSHTANKLDIELAQLDKSATYANVVKALT